MVFTFKNPLATRGRRTSNNTLITASKLKLEWLKNKKYHLQHAKFAHIETLRKMFDESKPSNGRYILQQNLRFSL